MSFTFKFRRGQAIRFDRRRWTVVKPGWRADPMVPYRLVEVYVLRLDRTNAVEHVYDAAEVHKRGFPASLETRNNKQI